MIRHFQNSILTARAYAIWLGLRFVCKLPDRSIARLARFAHDIAYPFSPDPDAEHLVRLKEFEELFLGGRPWSDVIRYFVLSGRKELWLAIFKGGLIHVKKRKNY